MSNLSFSKLRFTAIILFGLALSSSVTATAPPVRRPIACAPVFCVEVASRAPYMPEVARVSSELNTLESTLVVKLQNGVDVTFHSLVRRRANPGHQPPKLEWEYSGESATAKGCLDCNSELNPGKTFVGIVIRPISNKFEKPLSKSIDVCIWPLTMSAKNVAPENRLLLGDKVCISN